jgi:hypothetical protein
MGVLQGFFQTITAGELAVTGQWSEIIPLPNVPIHTHVLPTGKVLFWGAA